MALYFIGLGLCDEKDITIRGLDIIKKCDKVYLDTYTSLLINTTVEKLERYYNKKIILADRKILEEESKKILDEAKNYDVAILIPGDVFFATTHISIFIDAKRMNIDTYVINNASVMNAISVTGLSLYKFGRITSLVFPTENEYPSSPYFVLYQNLSLNLHTLFLLDINKKENKYMSVNEAISILLKLEETHKKNIFTKDTYCVGIARIGCKNQIIKYGPAFKLLKYDFGNPLHSLIVPAKLHFKEEEALKLYEI